jgi:acyl-CoA reductase-like NAD-dependent aldehyde dehydrogenase
VKPTLPATVCAPPNPDLAIKAAPSALPQAGEGREGAGAHIYSRDIGRIWCVAETLECGSVGINDSIISTETARSGDMSYGLELRSGLSVARSTGTETCS